jgi:hypothetical protein
MLKKENFAACTGTGGWYGANSPVPDVGADAGAFYLPFFLSFLFSVSLFQSILSSAIIGFC